MRILYIPTFNKTTDIDLFFKENKKETIIEENPELILVSGGDGSLLHAIQDYQHLKVPFIGIANGTVNFLMNDFCQHDFKRIKKEDFKFIKAFSLKVKVKRKRSNGTNKVVFKAIATNDIVFGGRVMDYNKFQVKGIKKESIDIKGMGLLFSTAIGSTAFHYNNGGNIIEDIGKGIIGVSSIVSEREKSFNKEIELKNSISIKVDSERSICNLYIDGETQVFELKRGDKIYISRGPAISLGFKDIEEFKNKRKSKIDKILI